MMNGGPIPQVARMPLPAQSMLFRTGQGMSPGARGMQNGRQQGGRDRRGGQGHHGNNSGMKRPFGDISNDQPELVRGTLLENESSKIDIKEDGFYSGPYKQERMIVFDVEHFIEEEELKDDLTVGDRVGKPLMCPWCATPYALVVKVCLAESTRGGIQDLKRNQFLQNALQMPNAAPASSAYGRLQALATEPM